MQRTIGMLALALMLTGSQRLQLSLLSPGRRLSRTGEGRDRRRDDDQPHQHDGSLRSQGQGRQGRRYCVR